MERFNNDTWKIPPKHPHLRVNCAGEVVFVATNCALKQYTYKSGHKYVYVGNKLTRQVHHLVMEAFVGERPKGLECRHLDGNPWNNHLSNLKWGTRSENIHDYIKLHGHHMAPKSMSYDLAREIKGKLDGVRGTVARLAREYNVPVYIVKSISRGSSFRYV